MATEILWSWSPGETRLALVRDGRLADFQLVRPEFLTGAVVRGRITELAPKMGAAFVDIGVGEPAFLNNAKGWVRGQSAIFQVKAEAGAGKGAQLTPDVTLAGRLLAYTPSRPGLTVSRKLGEDRRDQLLERLAPLVQDHEGVTAWTQAANAYDQTLQEELDGLRAQWRAIQTDERPAPAILWRPDPLARLLADNPGTSRIVVDDPLLLPAARAAFAGAVDVDNQPGLFDRAGVSDQLAAALDPVVTLACGGRLTIERTAALTAMDIDSAGANPLEANTQSVAAIARALRLRNISGQIVVDFVSVGGKGQLHKLVAQLKQAVARDPVATHVIGITNLGLVEMTRERKGPGLAELLLERKLVPNADALALEALEQVWRDARANPGARLSIQAAQPVLDALYRRSQALATLQERLGWQPALVRADGQDRFLITP